MSELQKAVENEEKLRVQKEAEDRNGADDEAENQRRHQHVMCQLAAEKERHLMDLDEAWRLKATR